MNEQEEQIALMDWAQLMSRVFPELKLLYHVPNEGKRSKTAGAILKAMGLKKGVPDVVLPVARGNYHGLYIELKCVDSGHATKEQLWWLEQLEWQGYAVAICRGWQRASLVITNYLKLGGKPNDNNTGTGD